MNPVKSDLSLNNGAASVSCTFNLPFITFEDAAPLPHWYSGLFQVDSPMTTCSMSAKTIATNPIKAKVMSSHEPGVLPQQLNVTVALWFPQVDVPVVTRTKSTSMTTTVVGFLRRQCVFTLHSIQRFQYIMMCLCVCVCRDHSRSGHHCRDR